MLVNMSAEPGSTIGRHIDNMSINIRLADLNWHIDGDSASMSTDSQQTCRPSLRAIMLAWNFAFCHAQTSQANILHLDQKAAKCTTCKWLYGKF